MHLGGGEAGMLGTGKLLVAANLGDDADFPVLGVKLVVRLMLRQHLGGEGRQQRLEEGEGGVVLVVRDRAGIEVEHP
ncbi:hypothetical protein HC891_27480 [Candidatus Gracilibacteria bacterium]|nr:hypothetical protein [Candidatus Gracilibacteria bacterium]